jgi:hypothetical protein
MRFLWYKLFWAMAAVLLAASVGCASKGYSEEYSAVTPAPAKPAEQVAGTPRILHPPTAAEMQVGIQIVRLGVTASGGLVDLRFIVLDSAKASAFLNSAANVPTLVADNMPPLMPPHKPMHGARFSQGQLVYVLYPNLRGTLKPGAAVMVVMGDARLGPVTVQ